MEPIKFWQGTVEGKDVRVVGIPKDVSEDVMKEVLDAYVPLPGWLCSRVKAPDLDSEYVHFFATRM